MDKGGNLVRALDAVTPHLADGETPGFSTSAVARISGAPPLATWAVVTNLGLQVVHAGISRTGRVAYAPVFSITGMGLGRKPGWVELSIFTGATDELWDLRIKPQMYGQLLLSALIDCARERTAEIEDNARNVQPSAPLADRRPTGKRRR